MASATSAPVPAVEAAAAEAAAATTTEPPLQVDSIPTVDLGVLSQSELYSLSLCSSSTFDPLRCDDVVIPKIDRSVFNESAGSRKQTYSRLRLAPASAADSAVSPSSHRRRGPHLRHTSNLPYQYLDNDPERAENQQILALLKQLFGLDSSICASDDRYEELGVSDDRDEELVPVRVDYLHSDSQYMTQLTNDSHLVLQSANAGVAGKKRKRGRPRKDENALVLVENKVENQCSNDSLVNTVNNAIVVYQNENVEDRDKEILNRDGVEVDLVALGAMEDPYAQELRRRTEGMGTEVALLEFLSGLNGQWGSRRKKRRIVDASEFGNALPRGWALLLSVKKKDGHVWLFCRRYISPNGRQFASCKEISSYLLSLLGDQGANQLTCCQKDVDCQTANSMVFVDTVGVAIVDEKIDVNPASQISPAAAFPTGNFEVEDEVASKTGDVPAGQAGEVLRCDNCTMTFAMQDDLLQHQLSHRRRKKNSESITDGVIIKDGKFECQICHKTFLERHRYNGHMGAHVRKQVKCSDQNQATNVEDCHGTGPFGLNPPGFMMKTSFALEGNTITKVPSGHAEHVLSTCLPHSNYEQNGYFKESNENMGKVDRAIDGDILKANLYSNPQAILENNEQSDLCGTSGGFNGAAFENEAGLKKSESESCSPVLLDQKPGTTEKSITGPSVNIEEPQVKADAGNVLLGSNENVGSCDIDLDDGHSSHKLTKDSATMLEQERDPGNCTALPSWNERVNFVENYNEVSTGFVEGHEQQKDSRSSLQSLSSVEMNCGVQPHVNGNSLRKIVEPQVNDVQNVGNNGFSPFSSNSNLMNMDPMNSSKHERRLEFHSFFRSENSGDNIDNVHSNLSEESIKQPTGRVLLAQSFAAKASQQVYNMNKIFAPQVDECKLSDIGNSNNDLCLASDSRANSKNVQLERYPAENFDVQSGIKHMFDVENNLNNATHNGQENPREDRASGIHLHDSAFTDQTCGFSNSFNMIYPGKGWEGQKTDEKGNVGNKFVIDTNGNNSHPVEDFMSGSIWRTGEENLLQTGSVKTSSPLERNFDIFSQKGEEGLFGVNQNYEDDSGFGGLRLGRSDPVEYSFMTNQSSNSIPGETKDFSFELNTGDDFGSSFWLGKDALMPGQNQVPTVCVWCRNEFYQEPISSGAQSGAIGSICPACNSKISQQFNVL